MKLSYYQRLTPQEKALRIQRQVVINKNNPNRKAICRAWALKVRQDPCVLVRWAAGAALRKAVKMGWVIKPDACEVCGAVAGSIINAEAGTKVKIQGHHWSYLFENWLKVNWVCQRCHAAKDREDHSRVHGRKGGQKTTYAYKNLEKARAVNA